MKRIFYANGRNGSQITIDGRSFSGDVTINSDGDVTVNGEHQGSVVGSIEISIIGDVDVLSTTIGNVTLRGSAGNVKTMSGDVEIGGPVTGSVNTMSGDVTCGRVQGSVKSMSGDIRIR